MRNDIEDQIMLAAEVGLMASLGPDGGWFSTARTLLVTPGPGREDPGPGWYVRPGRFARWLLDRSIPHQGGRRHGEHVFGAGDELRCGRGRIPRTYVR